MRHTDKYRNPLVVRYSSDEMITLFSEDMKFRTWRKLWIALAEGEKELKGSDGHSGAFPQCRHERNNHPTLGNEIRWQSTGFSSCREIGRASCRERV